MSSPTPHSTLEVDVAAQQENERQAYIDNDSSKLLPEVWVPLSDKPAHAPQIAVPTASAPQVIDSWTLPEPVPSLPLGKPQDGSSIRVCGLKKRTFWILVAAAVLVFVAVAVGAGVGVSQSNHSGSGGSDGNKSKSFLSTSKLAATNFTADGIEYNCVYYQLASGEIYQSVWDSNTTAWKVFAVAADADNILANTPISADLYWRSPDERRHHVFYYDSEQRIRGKAADTPYTDAWDDNNGIDNKDYGGNGISLASYAKECDACYNANAVVYNDGVLQYATPKTPNGGAQSWNQNPLPDGLPRPASATNLVIKPLYSEAADDTGKSIILFMATAHGKLAKLLYDGSNWDGENLNLSIASNSAIAAFTAGTFVNGSDSKSNYTLHVLTTQPGQESGGVTLSSYSSSPPSAGWQSDNLGFGFENVWNGSGLAANQAGKVYGTVLSNTGDPQLMEWSWNVGNGTYSVVGAVNTDVTS
ncbi:hypothetical protein MPH_11556 [Macrophomina phaseolina MS6]|uniref:Fucose-specific lectin n=1 Tax=Macrophomina phaseolina (strain MS6) TaxID=1126212 RepID=K2RA41_MACPH|nr:hypothetical protein MPH_11556 [Macrophomina phaseolina MS6]